MLWIDELHWAKFCFELSPAGEPMVFASNRNPHLASIAPHAAHEFQTPEMEWLIQRQILLHQIERRGWLRL